jgi:hypothetical protein
MKLNSDLITNFSKNYPKELCKHLVCMRTLFLIYYFQHCIQKNRQTIGMMTRQQCACRFFVAKICNILWCSNDLDRLGEWAVENEMKINPIKSKTIRFTSARVKDPINYSLMGTLIPEASSCKYLGIILRSDLSWTDQVNYAVKKKIGKHYISQCEY